MFCFLRNKPTETNVTEEAAATTVWEPDRDVVTDLADPREWS